MHKTKSPKTHSSIYSNSPGLNSYPQLAHRPFGSQIQKASVASKTPTYIENEAFAERQMEATGLEIQAKYGTITPEGQERLTVLQAKMDELLNSRLEHATRFGHNIANIPLRRPDTPTPIQAKLTIGEPGDKYEQQADETARQVVQRIHQQQSDKLQRETLPQEEDELQMKPEPSVHSLSLSPANALRPNSVPIQRRPMQEGKDNKYTDADFPLLKLVKPPNAYGNQYQIEGTDTMIYYEAGEGWFDDYQCTKKADVTRYKGNPDKREGILNNGGSTYYYEENKHTGDFLDIMKAVELASALNKEKDQMFDNTKVQSIHKEINDDRTIYPIEVKITQKGMKLVQGRHRIAASALKGMKKIPYNIIN